ncbi:MAG: helicase, partial [Halomonas sp.]
MTQKDAAIDRAAERRHLDHTLVRIEANLDELDQRLKAYAQEIQSQKEYLWSNRDEMDHIEKIAARESIEQSVMSGDNALA